MRSKRLTHILYPHKSDEIVGQGHDEFIVVDFFDHSKKELSHMKSFECKHASLQVFQSLVIPQLMLLTNLSHHAPLVIDFYQEHFGIWKPHLHSRITHLLNQNCLLSTWMN